jgi:hypothetical protein
VAAGETLGDREAGVLLAPALVNVDAAASRPQPATSALVASSTPAVSASRVARTALVALDAALISPRFSAPAAFP